MRLATLKHRVTISRLGEISGSHKTGRTQVATNVPCLIMPADPKALAARGMELNQGFDIYFNSDADIAVGDKVTHGSDIYKIDGLRPYIGHGANVDHYEATAQLQTGE